jgi:hypothetical protein
MSTQRGLATRHFIVFSGGHGGHSVIHFVAAPDLLTAVKHFILWSDGGTAQSPDDPGNTAMSTNWTTIHPDNSVECVTDAPKTIIYPHPLAFIEAMYKPHEEWQIRELPDRVWTDPVAEVFCGENAGDVEVYIDECRPLLRNQYPRSRAKAFIWYVKDGVIVTFFKRAGWYQIDVLARYLIPFGSPPGNAQPWSGTYDELLDMLLVRQDYLWPSERKPRTKTK